MCTRLTRLLWITFTAVKFVTLTGQNEILDSNIVQTKNIPKYDNDKADIIVTDVVVCLTDCGLPDFIDESVPDVPKIPKATNGEDFPWHDVR